MFRILLVGPTLAVLATVERHQRDLQLRRGSVPRGRLRRQFDPLQHRADRRGGLLIFTLVAIHTVDRFGRRVLMLVGCAGIAFFHTLIGFGYALDLKGLMVVIPVLATLACYAFSLAPVTWVLISEIFPNRIRGAAVSVAVSSLWIACFILTYTFPLLNAALGPAGTFWLYAGICAAGFVFILRCVPETKGKSLEQIERELVDLRLSPK